MNNSKKYLFLIVMILLVVIGVSLAYFGITIIGNDTAKGNKVVTGNLELTFNDSNELTLDGAFPGDYITKTISVKNTGTKEVSYNLVWTELTNGIINNELVIEATCKNLNSNSTEDGTCNSISQKAVSSASNITSNIPIKPGYTQEYTIKIIFLDTGKPQNYNKNKTFEGKLGITESSAKTVYCTYNGELTQGAEYVNGQYTYKYFQSQNVWSVTLTDKTDTAPVTSNICTYINDKPIASMSNMFENSQATTIDLSNINTSNVKSMSGMFNGSQAIVINGFENFNTSNVTNMAGMFNSSQVTEINGLENFDTSKVISMNNMFFETKVLTLDLSSFDTSNVKGMQKMFSGATNLKTIYVGNKFDIVNVTGSSSVFSGCTNLVGGAGTTYDSTKIDKTYARIDGGTDNPGYFTDVADKDIPEPNSFATDSWKTIAKAVRTNNTSKYNVGDTKTIDMGTYGIHTVRIANTSTPSECSTEGFSQTACGFVLEFADIITKHTMNDTATNVGGWPASRMYTFVNTDIYNALPSELRNVIIDTVTVSGHGSYDSANFTSTNKMYLLSPKEIYTDFSNSDYAEYDTAKDLTRTLDYYANKNVTTSNYSGASKNFGSGVNNEDYWWLRTARSHTNLDYYAVNTDGEPFDNDANVDDVGVSPAFRIG